MVLSMSQLLLACMPINVQCSNTKRGAYLKGVSKYIAVDKYKFIQLAHSKYYKMISVDIDNTSHTIHDIIEECEYNGLPSPTIIVETDKGIHIHWAFNNALWKNNKAHMAFRRGVLEQIAKVFPIDTHFAGFIMRNPILHDHYYSGILYDFIDFRELCDIDNIDITNETVDTKLFSGNMKYDFENTTVGNRNEVLHGYLRQFCFVNFSNLSITALQKEAIRVNNKFPVPQPENEVISVAASVYKFCSQNYNPNYASKNTIEKNIKLAKMKEKNTIERIYKNIVNSKISIEKVIRGEYSINYIVNTIKVARNTFKKHFKTIIKKLIVIIRRVENSLNNIAEYTFNTLYDLLHVNRNIVAHSISPPT